MYLHKFLGREIFFKALGSTLILSLSKALFIWSRVPETTLPLETTLRSVYMELWVVTVVPSSTLVSRETARQVTYWTKWRAPETIWAISPRVGEPKCLYEKKLSRLTGLPYLPRRDNSPTRVVSPPRDEFAFSCKQSVEFFKEISEKLARPG